MKIACAIPGVFKATTRKHVPERPEESCAGSAPKHPLERMGSRGKPLVSSCLSHTTENVRLDCPMQLNKVRPRDTDRATTMRTNEDLRSLAERRLRQVHGVAQNFVYKPVIW